MTDSDSEKLQKLIDLLVEHLQVESFRETNEDSSHNFFASVLEKLNEASPEQGGLTTQNTTIC